MITVKIAQKHKTKQIRAKQGKSYQFDKTVPACQNVSRYLRETGAYCSESLEIHHKPVPEKEIGDYC